MAILIVFLIFIYTLKLKAKNDIIIGRKGRDNASYWSSGMDPEASGG
jgi:hypothetical protein